MDAIDEIRERTLAAIVAAADPGQLDAVRVAASASASVGVRVRARNGTPRSTRRAWSADSAVAGVRVSASCDTIACGRPAHAWRALRM